MPLPLLLLPLLFSALQPAQARREQGREESAPTSTKRKKLRSPFKEDVVRLLDGTVLRGEILYQGPDVWRIRIAGGSEFAVPADQVVGVAREQRFAHETAHGGQLGLSIGLGGQANLDFAEQYGTSAGLCDEFTLSWAPQTNLELQLAEVFEPGGRKTAVGLRYYFNATNPVKAYTSTLVLVEGELDPLGLRLANGIQWDWGKHLGLFFHYGGTAYTLSDDSIHLGYHVEAGTQARF